MEGKHIEVQALLALGWFDVWAVWTVWLDASSSCEWASLQSPAPYSKRKSTAKDFANQTLSVSFSVGLRLVTGLHNFTATPELPKTRNILSENDASEMLYCSSSPERHHPAAVDSDRLGLREEVPRSRV